MKKFKKNDSKIWEIFIDKQLEKHNTSIKTIMQLPNHEIEGKPWYQYYTHTFKEESDWKEWCYNFYKTDVYGATKLSRKKFDRDFIWFNLMFGLRTIENEHISEEKS